ncbi:MAG: ketosteroid isomerase-related protein [Thalassobaculum sp.]|uniref:ketosteroid isomerase-related protein n=1 Tax=Thalassobaculum sp. TaxID=2022740 RepID=UPI0032ED9351
MDPRSATEALIRRYYDAFNRDDVEAMAGCLADDVAHDVNQGGRRVGVAAFRAFCAHMARCYRERLEDIAIMATDDGRRAAAEFVVDGRYLATDDGLPPATGQAYRLPAGAFFELRDGRIARITTHYNLADWTAQVAGGG